MITNDTIVSSTSDDSEETQEKPEKESNPSKVDFTFLKTGLALRASLVLMQLFREEF